MADKVTAAGVRFAYRLSLQSARQWEFHDLPGAVDLAIAGTVRPAGNARARSDRRTPPESLRARRAAGRR